MAKMKERKVQTKSKALIVFKARKCPEK